MTKIEQLRQSLGEKARKLDDLLKIVEGKEGAQARALSDTEQTDFDTLETEIEELQNQIEAEERIINTRNTVSKINKSYSYKSPEQKAAERFSVSRGLQLLQRGQLHGSEGGLEKELHEEGMKIARDAGLPIVGRGMMVPDFVDRADAATAAAASNLIGTNQMGIIEGYRPKLVLDELGATTHYGLVGINNFPVGDHQADAGFVAEGASSNTKEPNIRRPQAVAKAMRAKTKITWALSAQAGPSVDAEIRNNLMRAEANCLNRVAIKGGGSNEPTGIVADANVNVVAIGANGGALTYAKLIDMISNTATNDAADFGTQAFVSTPGVRGKLMQTLLDAGSGQFVWNPQTPEALLGYKALATSLTPSDLTKGSGTNLHAVLFGAWSQLHVCNWAVRELIIDPASDDTGTWVKLVSFWDLVIANPKAFSVIKDVDLTA